MLHDGRQRIERFVEWSASMTDEREEGPSHPFHLRFYPATGELTRECNLPNGEPIGFLPFLHGKYNDLILLHQTCGIRSCCLPPGLSVN